MKESSILNYSANNFETFCKMNRSYNGTGSLKENEQNFAIAMQVESEFYNRYDSSKQTPQRGDVVEFTDGFEVYERGNVESADSYGMLYLCENGSTFVGGGAFSTSGGAFKYLHASHFEFVGYTNRVVWSWGCDGAGAGKGIYFNVKVKKFRQKNMILKPWHRIHFGEKYYANRGTKVQVMKDFMYIAMEFVTIKAFNVFARYIGLTYHKLDDGSYYTDQFLKDASFWKLEELPEGAKPFIGLSCGRFVTCYAYNKHNVITIYRPNPNAKEVFKPIDGVNNWRKYINNPLGVE